MPPEPGSTGGGEEPLVGGRSSAKVRSFRVRVDITWEFGNSSLSLHKIQWYLIKYPHDLQVRAAHRRNSDFACSVPRTEFFPPQGPAIRRIARA